MKTTYSAFISSPCFRKWNHFQEVYFLPLCFCHRHEAIVIKNLYVWWCGFLFLFFFYVSDVTNHHSWQQLEDVWCCCCFKVFVTSTARHPAELPHWQYSSCYLAKSNSIKYLTPLNSYATLQWPIKKVAFNLNVIKDLLPACVFFPPPGECVLQRAVMVRKKLSAREGRGWLSGTLFCTHFRVAFVPQDSPKPDVRPSAQLLDASRLNPSSHVMFSPCHAGQCRPVAPGGSRRGFGFYWEGGGRWVKLLEELLFYCCTTSKLSMTY